MFNRRQNRQRPIVSTEGQGSGTFSAAHTHRSAPSQPNKPTLIKWPSENLPSPDQPTQSATINQKLAEHITSLQKLNETLRGQLEKNTNSAQQISGVARTLKETFPIDEPASDDMNTPSHKT